MNDGYWLNHERWWSWTPVDHLGNLKLIFPYGV